MSRRILGAILGIAGLAVAGVVAITPAAISASHAPTHARVVQADGSGGGDVYMHT